MQQFESERSSNIGWARYDEEKRELQVDFKNKDGVKTSTYVYDEFPLAAWSAFREAQSKGRYFAYEIRPRYVGRRLGQPAKPEAAPKPGPPVSGDLF